MAEIAKTHALVKTWKAKGAKVTVISGGKFQEPGLQDRQVVWKGMVAFVEFKDEKTVITPMQRWQFEDVNKHGGFAVIARFTRGVLECETDQGFYDLELNISLEQLYVLWLKKIRRILLIDPS